MIDGPFILSVFLLAVACVVGLRWTKPVPPVRPVVQEPEPLRIYHQPEPLPEPVHVFAAPTPIAYTDETVKLTPQLLRFLEGLQ